MADQKQLTHFKGLTSAEVEESRRTHGANILTPPEREPWWKLFLEKFDDPVIRILIIAAVIAIAVGVIDGKYAEGVGIILAVLLATTLAFLNEYKAGKEFDILNQVNDEVPIKVLRDGNFTTIAKKDLVVGDVVLLEIGEEIPADGEVLEAVSFQVNQSRLTGESVPVRKMTTEELAKQPAEEGGAYTLNMLYRGTTIADGHGVMRVTAVGDASELGKTARAAAEETEEETPLNMQLEGLSKLIGIVGFSIAALIYIALVFQDILTGELMLSSEQWYFVAVLHVSAIVALVRVWLPVIYDGFEFAGKEAAPPEWLENDSFGGWLKTAGIGAVIFAGAMVLGVTLGWVTDTPSDWLPSDVGRNFLEYFMISVTIIVVAVPEGLAMSVTLSLAYSMRKMMAANNLVRRMHACETIGAATVICSDKTGTLTMNEMRVSDMNFPFTKEASGVDPLIIESICANTTANLDKTGESPVALGNPTEGALLLWLDKQSIDYAAKRAEFPIIRQWTFSTERKYMGTLGTSPISGQSVLHAKGGPEIIMGRCSQILTPNGVSPLTAEIKAKIESELKAYQARGMRTLGVSYCEIVRYDKDADINDIAKDMIWLGCVAIADPVRPEVPNAIRECREAGIMVKIVTGDNPETAMEIARQINLWEDGDGREQYMTGGEFEKLTEEEAEEAVLKLKVLSRARPLDKMRLVRLLQKRKQVVAVTGDGTNDAPALNYANVGLAMGKTGTSVAKEASDIILLDDSFQSIVNGVMWGRSLYENIQRFILFQLTINVAALGIALLGPFIGVKIPLTVTQMLWVNLIMDTFAALALATEPPHHAVMKRPPRSSSEFIVTPTMTKSILGTGVTFLVILVGILLFIQDEGEVSTYNLSVFFSIFVMLQFWNLFNARCLGLSHSAFRNITENKGFVAIASAILIGQILIVQFGGTIFRTEPLSLQDWGMIIGGTSLVLWIGELVRAIKRGRSA
jgi:Ca2+-transporting ATPase